MPNYDLRFVATSLEAWTKLMSAVELCGWAFSVSSYRRSCVSWSTANSVYAEAGLAKPSSYRSAVLTFIEGALRVTTLPPAFTWAAE